MSSSRFLAYGPHLLCCLIILVSYLPVASEYYNHFPPSGFDFYLMAAYESYLRNDFGFWTGLWKYTWFCGVPLSRDYALLHMYLALPFASFLGNADGCRIYLLFTSYLFAVFSYLLFFELSKNKALSLLLANALVWSPNVYLVLFGGCLTFAATQMFLPLSLLFLVRYSHTKDKKLLFLSSGVSGLSILGHQAAGGLLVFLPSLIVLLFWIKSRLNLKKLGIFLCYIAVTMLICMPSFALYNYNFLTLSQVLFRIAKENPAHFARVYGPQAWNFFSTTNLFLYLIFGFALAYVIAKKPDKVVYESLSFIIILMFLIFFQLLFFLGYNPVQSFIQPYRTFWLFPLTVASIASVWLRSISKSTSHAHNRGGSFSFPARKIVLLLLLVLLLFPPLVIGVSMKGYLNGNCAEPFIVNEVLVKDRRELLKEIIPDWMDISRVDYRLFNGNPYLSVWWNIIFPMPVTHGYFQSLTPDQNYWKNWLDSSFTGMLYVWGKYNTTIIKNQSLFLIDWFAIKYMIGREDAGFSLAPYLNDYFNRVDYKQDLQFAEIKENLTSPIVEATNAPAILVISDHGWYRNILRDLFASVNLNSKYYVLIRGPEYIDDLSSAELTNFDCIYLYTYKYNNFEKAFEPLDEYVVNGGHLIIDTGFECPESGSTSLPEFFPINQTVRSPLGKEWNFKVSDNSITQGVNFSAFDPPIYENSAWTLSYAPSENEVKPEARVVLQNHGHPIIVVRNYGQGRVVWSGMNLPYHISQYKNLEEVLLHKNLVNWAIQPQNDQDISFNAERLRPEEAIVEGRVEFKGVLFKENAFDGWTALLTSDGASHRLEIYHAGPDFMYVRIPKGVEAPFTVKFRYRGPLVDWFFAALSSATLLIVLDYSVFRGYIVISRVLRPIGRKIRKRLSGLSGRLRGWWLKEE